MATKPMADQQTERYADDAPISAPHDDRFGRWPFSQRIAQILATRADTSSLAIGLYGPWGDGKTSVLNMMAGALARCPDVVCVRFNPWHFEDEPRLIRAFFETFADAIAADGATEAATLLTQYGRTLATPLGRDTEPSGAVAADRTLSSAVLDALKARINDYLLKSPRRTVVLVDDVDRLGRGGIHTLMKLVNLSASFSTTAYVLAIDADVVTAALANRYGEDGASAGRQFLEKIIQVPLHLPDAATADLEAACLSGVNLVLAENGLTFSALDWHTFTGHFAAGILPGLRTPRQVKRYLNSIRFAVPMLKGDVHVLDQLLLEAIRTVYPTLYLCVRNHETVFCGAWVGDPVGDAARKAAIELVESGLGGLGDAQHAGALYLLRVLFPRLNGLFGNTSYGAEWEATWSAEQRITAPGYFRRYFQYAVPARDTSPIVR